MKTRFIPKNTGSVVANARLNNLLARASDIGGIVGSRRTIRSGSVEEDDPCAVDLRSRETHQKPSPGSVDSGTIVTPYFSPDITSRPRSVC